LDGNDHLPLISVFFIAPQLELSYIYLEDKINLDYMVNKNKEEEFGKG
jgi:hypothetical protein